MLKSDETKFEKKELKYPVANNCHPRNTHIFRSGIIMHNIGDLFQESPIQKPNVEVKVIGYNIEYFCDYWGKLGDF